MIRDEQQQSPSTPDDDGPERSLTKDVPNRLTDVTGADVSQQAETHVYEVISQGFDKNEADLCVGDTLKQDVQVAKLSFKRFIDDMTQVKATATVAASTPDDVSSCAQQQAPAVGKRGDVASDSESGARGGDGDTERRQQPASSAWNEFHQQLEEMNNTFQVRVVSVAAGDVHVTSAACYQCNKGCPCIQVPWDGVGG